MIVKLLQRNCKCNFWQLLERACIRVRSFVLPAHGICARDGVLLIISHVGECMRGRSMRVACDCDLLSPVPRAKRTGSTKAEAHLRSRHGSSLHFAVSSGSPRCSQPRPLPAGGGSVQVLSRVLVPPPQLALHSVH